MNLQQQKSQTLEKYKLVESTYKTQFNVPVIKTLHTDQGGEYTGSDFENHLSKRGTAHTMPAHDSSDQNGKAECRGQALLDDAWSMLAGASDLPKSLWADAISYSTWLRNRLLPAGANAAPYEIVYGRKPDLKRAHTFGTKVWVRDEKGSKLDPRGRAGRWVGVPGSHDFGT
jgi:hypothetical protein